MKKIFVIFLLLIPLQVCSQTFLQEIYVDTIFYEYYPTIKKLSIQFPSLKPNDKTKVLFIPEYKVYKTEAYVMKLGLECYLYTYDENKDELEIIEPSEVGIVEFNLKTKKVKKKKYKHDKFNHFRDKEVKKKLKKKHKEKHKKPKPKPKPGIGDIER